MENANCLNTLGSYTCVCVNGYTGDGLSSCVSSEQSKKTLIIGLSAAIAGLVLIATASFIVILLAYLMKRNKFISTENVAYLSNTRSSSLMSNAAYAVSHGRGPTIHTNPNEAYALPSSINEASGTSTTTNKERDSMTITNEAYVATDIPTSLNEAYQTAKYSSASNPLTYDYVYDYIPHTT